MKGPQENDHRSGRWHRSSCSCGSWDCESRFPWSGPADLLDQPLNQDSCSAKHRSEHEMSSGSLLRMEWLGLVAEDASSPPVDRGGHSAGGQQQLYWVTFISLSVCPSEPEEPMDPGLACHPWFPDLCTDQWPYTFRDTVNISIVLTVLSLVSKKSPTKLKKHHVVNSHLSCDIVCWLRLHHSHSLVNNSHC